MKKALLAGIVLASFTLGACNEQSKVIGALNVVGTIFSLAQEAVPQLVAAGTLTPGDATAFNNWLAAGTMLLSQSTACVTALGASGKASAIANCVDTFANGLLSPAEMANLRIISPGAQKKVLLYTTAVVLAVNFAAQIVNAIQIQPPAVGTTTADQLPHEELHVLARQLRISPAYGF